ncbi:gliding motility lipoprotein GldH [Constantimarinum furrinae]|uniref:Gliding motility protein GldH n=1 Tax=Constantimarinum furrinae TaxID=2562285 RepID=A0A7G8PSW8_9FLAO|nr:gliding motility lipoprotein GldH [Constantimarinum furrinae]QNJ97434.1 gliding motility protein GldH [Constantimarinum furrinae]
MLRAVLILSILITVSACDSNVALSKWESLPGYWEKDRAVEFEFPAPDSLKIYNVFIHVRNTNDYKYNNIFLVVDLEFPHGKTITDTLEYKMAYPNGEWMGTGIGSIKENKLWYKENVSFREAGNYNIIITQAVRNNGEVDGVTNLEGITDIGVSVEEAVQQ